MAKNKKKTNKTRICCKNGVEIRSDITLSLDRRSGRLAYSFIQLFVNISAALSAIFMLEGFFNFDGSLTCTFNFTYQQPVIITVLLTSLSVLMLNKRQVFFKAAGGVYLICNSVFVLTKMKKAVNGLILLLNYYSCNARFSKPFFHEIASDIKPYEINYFLLAFSFVLTLIISLACIYRVNFTILFIATFPIFEAGTFWGWETYTWTVVLMLFSWITVLSLNLINHSTKNKNSCNTFAVYARKKSFYLTSEPIKKAFFGSAGTFAAIIMTVVFIISLTAVYASDNFRPKSFVQLRRDISNGFDDFTTELAQKNPVVSDRTIGRRKMIGGTNGGQLGIYESISFNGATAIRVSTEKFICPLYLRGYSAAEYKDNCWNTIKADKDTLRLFENDDMLPLDYNFYQLNSCDDISKASSKIAVKPVNADKEMIYAPYGADYSGCKNVKEQKYAGIAAADKTNSEYTVSYVYPDVASLDTLAFEAKVVSNNSSGKFSSYSDSVLDNYEYSFVPDELAPVLDEIIESSGVLPTDDVEQMKNKIKDYLLEEGFYYTTEPGVTPGNEDFIRYFLEEQKKGYCVYYASAGVMFMRRLGYPARYVEGYMIDPSQYKEGSDIRVSDRSAHAWCEVFISGYGWLPLEFTPGYERGNPNLLDSEKNISPINDSSSSSKAANSSSRSPWSRSDKSSKSSDLSSKKTASSKADSSSSNGLASADTSHDGGGGSDSAGNKFGTDGGGQTAVDFTKLLYILAAVVFVLVFAMALYVKRKSNISKLEKSINDEDPDKAVISCFKAYLRYLSLIGVECHENLSDEMIAGRILKELESAAPELCEDFIKLTQLAVASFMGKNKLEEEDGCFARKALLTANSVIFEKLDPIQRLLAKWVHNLY
ncbi:MAG: transglutaminase family protein [Oscillospiraceae bacterium]